MWFALGVGVPGTLGVPAPPASPVPHSLEGCKDPSSAVGGTRLRDPYANHVPSSRPGSQDNGTSCVTTLRALLRVALGARHGELARSRTPSPASTGRAAKRAEGRATYEVAEGTAILPQRRLAPPAGDRSARPELPSQSNQES